jgi:GTP-binding protein HflX
MEPLAELIQKRDSLDNATAMGGGKLMELELYIHNTGAEAVIFDHELSGVQIRNMEKACGVPVIDRTMLILEIFARRAATHEGKLQVELARQRYLLPRLSGMGAELSRLGGGGGGAGAGARRGKGESKLELDRRHIRRRITALEAQLKALTKRREQIRERREKDGVTSVAVVGYTNVGKSSLLNALTGAGVLVEDKLFATLDPSARALKLPDGRTVLLIDTVGLVRRLPHHLVEAFRSTLDEAARADLILNVCDISSADAPEQADITQELLKELGAQRVPVINVLNKADLLTSPPEAMGERTAVISAKSGQGLLELLEKIARLLPAKSRRLRLLIPYGQAGLAAEIRESGKIYEERFEPAGVLLDALVDEKLISRVSPLITTDYDRGV